MQERRQQKPGEEEKPTGYEPKQELGKHGLYDQEGGRGVEQRWSSYQLEWARLAAVQAHHDAVPRMLRSQGERVASGRYLRRQRDVPEHFGSR
ncbi:unnamed protein product [Phytophthora fragariaefolia]|uniref:Unnamed protein product n=1 Tax=Phytophthora fragariaefolia TaxID=1490495 RepID=A0A9W6Y5X3_9STRA|nr:unnamed protein product [Phytophthora fragariaefolia]